MTKKPHGDGRTACVRRLYLHARDGGRVSVLDMAQIVRWMEEKDQEIADLRAELQHSRRLDKLSETGTVQAFDALSDDDKLRWFAITGHRDKWARERIAELEAENERLRGLLKAASCPACGGSGVIPLGPTPDGVWEGRQCQWCDEKQGALAPGGKEC